tara:strand:+ start:58 stop:831 length:774 start_codon:yes stop_codon:yes gene_type:complete
MQGESIFLLIFIFIILIAVGIIGILYFIHTSKYDESNTFYKNLLEIIKKNPNLSNDLEDKLFEKDFDIDDISDSQKELSNIFGAKIYSETQLNSLNQNNKDYVNTQLSNYPLRDSNEYKYLVNSYSVINNNDELSNIYNYNISASKFTSNLDLSYKFFKDANSIDNDTYLEMITDIETINTSNTHYNSILGNNGDNLSNLYSFYQITDNTIELNTGKTFKINIDELMLCKYDDDVTTNCSNLVFDGTSNVKLEEYNP